MIDSKYKRRLIKATVVFWLLLLYIVAALIWWYISLEAQNKQIYNIRLSQAALEYKLSKNTAAFETERHQATDSYLRGRVKYTGEGAVFLGLILIGAFFVYRSIRKQIRMQLQQQNFMMAVTHELKTPIAVAKLNLETLLKYELEAEKQHKLMNTTLDETKRLDFLTNNILVSSQLENEKKRLNREELDFSSLVQDRVSAFRSRYSARIFEEVIDPDADISGDPLLLQLLINNLLENAVKYSDKENPISITLAKKHGAVIMKVADQGIGIPENEKKMIFKKFYRIGNEPTRKKQGTGLGLYICALIAAEHRANIIVKANKPKGSIFEVNFKV